MPLVLLALLLIAAPLGTVQAQDAEPPATSSAEARLDSAIVEIDGEELFALRGVGAFPAQERVREVARRLAAAAADPKVLPSGITTSEIDLGTAIVAGDRVLVVITDLDAQLLGATREIAAPLYVRRISQAIERYREDRDPKRLARNGLIFLGHTLLFAALLAFLGWLRRIVQRVLEARYKHRIRDLKIQSVQFVQHERLWGLVEGTLRTIHLALALVLTYVWASTSLTLLPWTRGIARDLLDLVLDPLRVFGLGIVGFVPNLLFLLVLMFLVRLGLKVLKLLAAGVEQGTVTLSGFEPEWAWPTYRIFRLLILAFAVVVAYPYIPGSSSNAFKGVSLFLGLMISLGSSSVIGNLLAGYSMTYRRAFRVGDRIRVEDVTGDVVETRLLVTHLRTPKNEEVIVPNGLILNGKVINYSSMARKQGLILHATVGIGYETPWRQVEAMLLLAASRTPGLLAEPKPFVNLLALGDFCVTYELNVHTADPHAILATYSALHRGILDVFNEYGVQIMTPAYEGDPEQPKIVPREHWHEPPAAGPDSHA